MPKFIENRAQILIKSTKVPQNPAKLILIDKKALLSPIKGDLDGYRLAFSRYFSYLCIRTSLRHKLVVKCYLFKGPAPLDNRPAKRSVYCRHAPLCRITSKKEDTAACMLIKSNK